MKQQYTPRQQYERSGKKSSVAYTDSDYQKGIPYPISSYVPSDFVVSPVGVLTGPNSPPGFQSSKKPDYHCNQKLSSGNDLNNKSIDIIDQRITDLNRKREEAKKELEEEEIRRAKRHKESKHKILVSDVSVNKYHTLPKSGHIKSSPVSREILCDTAPVGYQNNKVKYTEVMDVNKMEHDDIVPYREEVLSAQHPDFLKNIKKSIIEKSKSLTGSSDDLAGFYFQSNAKMYTVQEFLHAIKTYNAVVFSDHKKLFQAYCKNEIIDKRLKDGSFVVLNHCTNILCPYAHLFFGREVENRNMSVPIPIEYSQNLLEQTPFDIRNNQFRNGIWVEGNYMPLLGMQLQEYLYDHQRKTGKVIPLKEFMSVMGRVQKSYYYAVLNRYYWVLDNASDYLDAYKMF